MNTPKTLNSILNIIIFLIIISLVLGVLFTILTLTGSTLSFMPPETLENYSKHTPDIYIFMGLTLGVYLIFGYGLFRLKKAAKLFLSNNIYNEDLSKNINVSGICMIVSGIFWWLFDGLGAIHFKNSFSIGVSEKTFIYLFFVAIGLFMMLVSKVFNNARQLKEENDLTI